MEQSSIRVVPALLAGGLELVREDRRELAHFVGSLPVSDVRLRRIVIISSGSRLCNPSFGRGLS